MEKFDKNYIIGFVLLFLMYGSYMYFYEPSNSTEIENKKNEVIAQAPKPQIVTNSNAPLILSDSSTIAIAKTIEIENEDIKAIFSTNGGTLKKVFLKKYKTYNDYINNSNQPMVLFDADKSYISLLTPTNKGTIDLNKIPFETNSPNQFVKTKDSGEIIFISNVGLGSSIEKKFKLSGTGFVIEEAIKINNAGGQFLNAPTQLVWTNQLEVLENDITENRKSAQINYYDKEGNFDEIGFGGVSDETEKAEQPIKWFSFKQKYFTTGIVNQNSFFENTDFNLLTPQVDSFVVKTANVKTQLPYDQLLKGNLAFKLYFGPNELKQLKSVSEGFQQNLYLGYDIVKPINLYVFVPLFNWVESFIGNYGLLIILVVLIIKITLTPLIYKSYVSSAKMRLLAPEIAAIKEKVGDDAVKVQQETMTLYKQVGVSPLSGCVPLLLQMPILMSVFFLFPNMSMFRQKEFLWSHDLSTYDAPISWLSTLPIIGNHISLFVVLMTLSSLAFTYYNNQITPDQPGPIDMKKLSYVFPLVFFFVLNSFPAALSFYYLVSNLVTIAQQLIVRKFIDEEKIMAILETNRKNFHTKPQKKNKFGDFIQKQLQASEDLKKQSEDRKKSPKKK